MKDAIERFLRCGEYDDLAACWPGGSALERMIRAKEILTVALLEEVRRRAGRADNSILLERTGGYPAEIARAKLAPMVRGLFPRAEQKPVLDLLEKSVVFLTPDTIEGLVRGEGFLGTAWDLANIYLSGIGAAPLGEEMRGVVGLSVETNCYISMAYFGAQEELSDYVVHEAAHVFHNTKRQTIGLAETGRREWLLPIAYRKRETFAYACETYSRIMEIAKRPAARKALLETVRERAMPSDERIDPDEYLAILADAIIRRNGWKTILDRCSEPTHARSRRS